MDFTEAISSNTFDVTNALAALFLWLLFGLIGGMVNCDLQRLLASSDAVRHVTLLVAFFFLFTLIDGGNNAPLWVVFVKTLVVYVLFVFATKSKAYFVIPTLLLLMASVVVEKQRATWSQDKDKETQAQALAVTNFVINIVIAVVIVTGMLHYLYLQRLQHGPNFSLTKFIFSANASGCSGGPPQR
jgi:hypothetical protein